MADRIVGLLVEKFAVEGEVTPATRFSDIDIDSLVMLELSVILEHEYGRRIPGDELMDAGNADAIADLLTAAR
ncbi:hypothetical protein BG452_22290 [Streptomyces sp. CBMA123]|nr:hypothetical protein [Streptomyces sp. CBMA123]